MATIENNELINTMSDELSTIPNIEKLIAETRTCTKCGITKPVNMFSVQGYNKTTGKTYYIAHCKACRCAYVKATYHSKIKVERIANQTEVKKRGPKPSLLSKPDLIAKINALILDGYNLNKISQIVHVNANLLYTGRRSGIIN